MYVCLCAGVTEKQIREALQTGEAKTMSDLQQQLDVNMNCGECCEQVETLLQHNTSPESSD
ncbi:MAG: (2Fe-2S)-binding protein [Gammaproteobacteria bacterium]